MKGIIFDLDGTLLDSMNVWNHLGEQYLKSLGIQAEDELDDKLSNMSLSQSACYLKQEYQLQESVEELIQGIQTIILDKYKNTLCLKEGVKEFIIKCSKQNIPMCVLTASTKVMAESALKRNGILTYFKAVLSCEELGFSKQDKNSFLSAATALHLPMESCILIEDALYAIACAKQAGCYVCAIYDEANANDWKEIQRIADETYMSFEDMEVFYENDCNDSRD